MGVRESSCGHHGGSIGTDGSSATVEATVNPNGVPVSECKFEYGPTPSYGSSVPCSASAGSGLTPVTVSAPLNGLSPNTRYDFRIAARNESGVSFGEDETFTTPETSKFKTRWQPIRTSHRHRRATDGDGEWRIGRSRSGTTRAIRSRHAVHEHR